MEKQMKTIKVIVKTQLIGKQSCQSPPKEHIFDGFHCVTLLMTYS